MQFDSEKQKQFILTALNEFPCKLGQAQELLQLAQTIVAGEVVETVKPGAPPVPPAPTN